MQRRRFLATTMGVAATVALARPARAQTLTTVHVGGSPNDDLTSIVYAQKMGLYQRAGLEVVIEKSTSGAAAAAAVAAGAFDIAKSSTSSIFDAHIRGVPFTLLGPSANYDNRAPYGGFLLASGSLLRNGKEAEGQTVSVASLSSVGRVAFAAWVEQRGGDPKAVKFVEVPIPAVPAALDQKRILAGETSQPTQASAIANGYRFLAAYDAIALQFAASVLYTTKDYSAKNPGVIRAFMKVTYDSARICNGKPDSTLQMMSDFTGVSLEVMQKTPRVGLGTELILAQVQSPIDAAAKYGVLAHGFPARELVDVNVTFR